jgi:thiol-disulfide isomerase/thioredoxin
LERFRGAGVRLALICWILLVGAPFAAFAQADSPAAGAAGESIVWAADWDSALEQAQIEGRIVMVDFFTTWCGWCKRLDRETYADPRVTERCGALIAVKVDGDRRRDLAKRYGVTGYPTIGFLHADGTPLQMVVGFQSAGNFVATLDRLLDRKSEEFVLRQRLRDHPELVDVRSDLATLLAARGDATGAVAQLDTLLAARDALGKDQYWELSLARAKALLALGRSHDARDPLKEYVKHQKKSPRLPEALYLLGEACFSDGDRKEARKSFRKLLEIRGEGWLAARCKERLADLG